MPEVYTLRAPENFSYNNVRPRSSTRTTKQNRILSSQKPEFYHLKSNDNKRIPSNNLLKPTSASIYNNSTQRTTTPLIRTNPKSSMSYQPLDERKPEMFYIKSNDQPRRSLTVTYNSVKQRPMTASTNIKPKSAISYQPLNERKAEMYHIKSNDPPRRSSISTSTNNKQRPVTASTNIKQKTPIPYQPLNDRKAEMYHLRSNEDRQNNLLKPLSSTLSPKTTTNSRSKPTSAKTRDKISISYQPLSDRKPEMYHISSQTNRQSPSPNEIPERPKSKGILTRSNTPDIHKVNTYTKLLPNEEPFLPYIPRTPSPPIYPTKKNQYVSFNPIDHNDKYEILERQRHSPSRTEYIPLHNSKAMQSIQRSMNRYRFRAS